MQGQSAEQYCATAERKEHDASSSFSAPNMSAHAVKSLLQEHNLPTNNVVVQTVMQMSPIRPGDHDSRREVLQHAEAYHFLCVTHIKEPLTADLILRAHGILMNKVMHSDIARAGQLVLAGQYRSTAVFAGFVVFPPYSVVPRAVENLLERYEAFKADKRDPYSLASVLSYDFVAIHPFEDGNGRMSRLLLNRVLAEYGLPFPIALGFGSHHKARAHYMQCIANTAKRGGQPKQLSTVVLASVRHGWQIFMNGCPSPVEKSRESSAV